MVGNKKHIKTIRKKYYDIVHELWDTDCEYGPTPTKMKSAYSKEGVYIGKTKFAYHLTKKFNIEIFKKAKSTSSVCSIGYAPTEGKIYGWSHRAIYGFKIGDTVKKGDVTSEYLSVGFTAKNEKDVLKMAKSFARGVC